MGSESVVCELAAAKTMAVQSRRELRVIWFLALGVIASPVDRHRVRFRLTAFREFDDSRPARLTLHPIRLQTITTRQNCGESLWR
jgi:hypothetical protein